MGESFVQPCWAMLFRPHSSSTITVYPRDAMNTAEERSLVSRRRRAPQFKGANTGSAKTGLLVVIGIPVGLIWAGAALNLFGDTVGVISVVTFVVIAVLSWKRTDSSADSSSEQGD